MSSKQFRDIAWNKLSGKWNKFALITFLQSIIIGFSNIASLLICGTFELGYSNCIKTLSKGREVNVSNLFDGFNNFSTSFLLSLLVQLCVLLWSLLLFVPGIIAYYSYSMSFYILNDNPIMTASEAKKASKELMKGHKWQLFCLHFSYIGWYITSIFTFGILFFWITPYVKLATYEFYEKLRTKQL